MSVDDWKEIMLNPTYKTSLLVLTGFLLISLLSNGCDRKSSINNFQYTLAAVPPFDRDSVPEPPLIQSDVAVLAHSRYSYYDLAKEIAAYYNAPLIHTNENSNDSLVGKLRQVQAKYVIVVLPPFLIKQDSVSNLFHVFCSLDNDPHLDVGYCYVTGYTVDDARSLFYSNKTDTTTVGKYLGISEVFDGDESCHYMIQSYSEEFRAAGWGSDTAIFESYPIDNVSIELPKLQQNQMVFFIGHGDFENSCGISSTDLKSIDLSGDIIFSGTCLTGNTFCDDPTIDPIALRILKCGTTFYVANVNVSGWDMVWFIAQDVCKNSMNYGDAIKDGINREIDWEKATKPTLSADEYISCIIPFGDPKGKPRLKSAVSVYVN